MFIEARLFEITESYKSHYTFIDSAGNKYTVKYPYIFGEPYSYCKALLKDIKVLGEYAALIK